MWSRRYLSGAMLLMLVVSPAGVSTSHAGVSCAPLKRLLDYTDSGFRQLRGYFDPRLKSWVATYRMVGASICTIEDIENIAIYSCKWTHDPQNSAVPEAYADMLQSVPRCLAISASSEHSDGPEKQSTRFQVAGSRKTIVVERNESGSSGFYVSLHIVPMGLKDFRK